MDDQKRYGPWAVVTGASEGIGRAFAVALAARGFSVVLVARRKEVLSQLAEELQSMHRVQTRVVAVDLGQPDGVERLAAETATLDVGLLVASAGFGTSGELVDGDVTLEANMVDLNCRAVVGLAHHYGRRLVQRGRGGMVLLSSLVAFQGVPRAANYAATKAYVQTLAEGLAMEMAPHGVDVLACAPGPIRSGFAARAGMVMGMAQTPDVVAEATLRALGRSGTVRPGWLAKLLETMLATLPRWGRTRVMAQVMAGMTPKVSPTSLPQPR